MRAFLSLSLVIGLDEVGLVKDQNWQSQQQLYDLADEYNCVVQGVVSIDSPDNMLNMLNNDVYYSSAVSFMAIAGEDTMLMLMEVLPHSTVLAGFIWFAPQVLMDPVTGNLVENGLDATGWFTLKAAMDTSQDTYQDFLALYENNRAADSPAPTYYSAAVFNALVGVAEATKALFEQKIYTSSQTFAESLRSQMADFDQQRNVAGAGMDLTFSAEGNARVPYDLLNWNGATSSVIGHYNTLDDYSSPSDSSTRRFAISTKFAAYFDALISGGTADSTSGMTTIVLPGGVIILPTKPENNACPADQMNENPSRCKNCTLGTYTSEPGYNLCLDCPVGTYTHSNLSKSCLHCPAGTTTWAKGSKSISDCMCKENYYDSLRLKPSWSYAGCFNDCGNTTHGDPTCTLSNSSNGTVVVRDLPVIGGASTVYMNLQMCNELCLSLPATYLFFGITQGTQCWCGDQPGTHGVTGTCNVTCSGQPDVECGGETSISVYEVAQLTQLRQNIQAVCKSCPTTIGALEELHGSTCQGGWSVPVAKPKFWSSVSFPDHFYKCFYGRCTGGYLKGSFGVLPMQGNYSIIQECGSGAKGRMCAGCEAGYWKFGKDCKECPSQSVKYLTFLISPFLCLMFFPLLKYLIAGYRVPSVFVTNTYLQITALFGGFAINWPNAVQTLLAEVSVVNFNWNLMFFGCYEERPKFMENWIMFQLLPIYYALFFFGRHYVYKRADIQPGSLCCTFSGSTPKSFFGATSWYASLSSTLFMGNLLYVATLSKSLAIFACEQVADGTYYMTQSPTIVCYEGDHLILMGLASIAMVVYSTGWPVSLFFAFRIAERKYLLSNAKFKSILGFLYTRFEMDWFWWHVVIITQKVSMVMIKTFAFDNFFQCPAALAVSFGLMGLQVFARPYASDILNKLQTGAYGAQFLYLFLGLLFATEKGEAELNDMLVFCFFAVFFIMKLACVFVIFSDIRRYVRLGRIETFSDVHQLGLQAKQWVIVHIYNFLEHHGPSNPEETVHELQMMKNFSIARSKYPIPAHLDEYFFELAKSSPILLELVCYPMEMQRLHHELSDGHFGHGLVALVSRSALGLSIENQPGSVIKEDVEETMAAGMSFILRDYNESRQLAWNHTVDPRFTRPRYIQRLFKPGSRGNILYFMCICTDQERENAIAIMKKVYENSYGVEPQTLQHHSCEVFTKQLSELGFKMETPASTIPRSPGISLPIGVDSQAADGAGGIQHVKDDCESPDDAHLDTHNFSDGARHNDGVFALASASLGDWQSTGLEDDVFDDVLTRPRFVDNHANANDEPSAPRYIETDVTQL